jgi:O-antigen ligase
MMPPPSEAPEQPWPVLTLAIAAAALPSLLAYNVSPSPTFLNQALAFALWAMFAGACAWLRPTVPGRGAWQVAAALLLLGACAAWSWGPGGMPSTLALSALATLAAALLMLAAGAAATADNSRDGSPSSTLSAPSTRETLFAAFAWAWFVAGLFNVAVALVQVFAPALPDGNWIAASGIPGRAVGNLRQPNHLSSLLLWSCIATVALLDLRQLSRRWAALALAAFVFGVVLTASRTGLISVLLLALWGLADRRLSRPARQLLVLAPLVYAASWWGMAEWAKLSQHNFGGTARLAESDISGSRFGIWKNTLALIQAHPWTGVGFGEFNFAWTLTPFPGRPTAFFDHTHNLPLQLAVELGLPMAALLMALLLWGLGRAAWSACTVDDADASTAQRAAVLVVVMIGLHSLLEYPLWYSYFLLPTAWAFGFALRGPAAAARATPRWLAVASWLLAMGTVFSVWDYGRVVSIFSSAPGSPPLEQRVASGQQSVFFGHHADYAAVTSRIAQGDPARAFDRTAHYLLDTRLMMTWSEALATQGRVDEARYVSARLKEFGKQDAEDFFDACLDAPAAAAASAAAASAPAEPPFQCSPPAQAHSWRSYLPPN